MVIKEEKMSKESDLISLFAEIGLTEQKARETLKNEALSESLKAVINEVTRPPFSALVTSKCNVIMHLYSVSHYSL